MALYFLNEAKQLKNSQKCAKEYNKIINYCTNKAILSL